MLKFLLIVLLIAIMVYAVTRVLERRGKPPVQRRPQGPPRPLGPDDDPDFLREIERRRRRRRDEPDTT